VNEGCHASFVGFVVVYKVNRFVTLFICYLYPCQLRPWIRGWNPSSWRDNRSWYCVRLFINHNLLSVELFDSAVWCVPIISV